MTYTGITIGGIDTYTAWGLILCADLQIGKAPLKTRRIDLPGADGTLDLTYALTDGVPVFGDRPITFTLAAPGVSAEALENIRVQLATHCHGRVMSLHTPLDDAYHYRGVFDVAGISGYQSRVIPISVQAEPYMFKNDITEVVTVIPQGGNIDVVFHNDMRIVTPTFRADAQVLITQGINTYALSADADTRFPKLKFSAGENPLNFSGDEGTIVTATYQEARL